MSSAGPRGAKSSKPAAATSSMSPTWFGSSRLDADEDKALFDGEAVEDSTAPDAPTAAPRAHALGRPAALAGGTAFQRLYRACLGARAALGLALLSTLLLAAGLGASPLPWVLSLCALYVLQALLQWRWPRLQSGASAAGFARLRSSPHWWSSIGLDLLLFGLLHWLDRSGGFSYGALLVMPVLMGGVLTPRLLALATAAMAALIVLGTAWWSVLLGADAGQRMTQSGLAGMGFFIIGLLASELAARLAREERAARGSLELARQQAQLSRLVIDEMQEGVLAVDRRGLVRAANPAARGLLSDGSPVGNPPFVLRGAPAWLPLVEAVERAFAEGAWPAEGRDVSLPLAQGETRALRLRMRFTRRREAQGTEDLCVLFVEDVRNVLARSRQEKLAAMGRVSAGIAHEIRNPLAAIDQANALLAEDCGNAPQAQALTAMVASNVQRLKRIVDDVTELAPGLPPQPVSLDAAALVAEICADWVKTNKLPTGPDSHLALQLPSQPLWVSFEPDHLRRVLVNLLDNALRHALPGPQGVHLSLRSSSEQWARLSVFSAGEPIPPDVERHLFEPFFSTRSRGSGLGLYICRELCERYGGRIDYQRQRAAGHSGNEFVISLRRVAHP